MLTALSHFFHSRKMREDMGRNLEPQIERSFMTDQENYLTPLELIKRYKNSISLRTLANWRSNGDGPNYTKIGGKVLYSIADVIQWEKHRRK